MSCLAFTSQWLADVFRLLRGIIVLCLTLSGSAFVVLLQPYQTNQALNRLSDLMVPLGAQIRFMRVGAGQTDLTCSWMIRPARWRVRITLARSIPTRRWPRSAARSMAVRWCTKVETFPHVNPSLRAI